MAADERLDRHVRDVAGIAVEEMSAIETKYVEHEEARVDDDEGV